MARNSSPTTELSVTFECLRLNSETQSELDSQVQIEELDWRENSPRTDQSNQPLQCTTDGFLGPNLVQPTDYLVESGNSQWSDHLTHNDTLEPENQQTPPLQCQHHHTSCDCHSLIGSELPPHYCTSSISPPSQPQILSCRQEALYNDVTVEELAGYFDDLLHLPKPMSVMAELMYT